MPSRRAERQQEVVAKAPWFSEIYGKINAFGNNNAGTIVLLALVMTVVGVLLALKGGQSGNAVENQTNIHNEERVIRATDAPYRGQSSEFASVRLS